jgi:hypothetical protein
MNDILKYEYNLIQLCHEVTFRINGKLCYAYFESEEEAKTWMNKTTQIIKTWTSTQS